MGNILFAKLGNSMEIPRKFIKSLIFWKEIARLLHFPLLLLKSSLNGLLSFMIAYGPSIVYKNDNLSPTAHCTLWPGNKALRTWTQEKVKCQAMGSSAYANGTSVVRDLGNPNDQVSSRGRGQCTSQQFTERGTQIIPQRQGLLGCRSQQGGPKYSQYSWVLLV